MPHEHESGVTHDHDRGELPHDHDDERTGRLGRRDVVRDDDTVAHDREHVVHDRAYPYRVRGGFSFGSILTGMAVALGAMLLLTALIGGIIAAAGVDGGATAEEVTTLGWSAAIGLIVAQLLAYLWGGYTAGRMARGWGWLNGLMVPIAAILLAVLIGLLVRGLGVEAGVNVPYADAQVPVGFDVGELSEIGLVAGIGSLIAMFVGGILGGMIGARWHDRLEARRVEPESRLRAA